VNFGTKNSRLVFWDTSVVLAWLNEERDKPLAAIDSLLREHRKGEFLLGFCVVSRAEVLYTAREEKLEWWRQFLCREDVVEVQVDDRIAERAAEIRKCAKERQIKVPPLADALVIASAERSSADVLHACDRKHILRFGNEGDIVKVTISEPGDLSGQMWLLFSMD